MRPSESFIGQPIRSLQTMLRVIAENDPSHVAIVPDGIYGPETVRAVSVIQRRHGIPVTGVTDQNTWETVVALYEDALVHQDEAQALHIILNPGQVLRKGEQSAYIRLAQALLEDLAQLYGSIGSPGQSGILDEATADSLASFQALAALPMTGELDKHTWKHLALHYPLAVNRRSNGSLP